GHDGSSPLAKASTRASQFARTGTPEESSGPPNQRTAPPWWDGEMVATRSTFTRRVCFRQSVKMRKSATSALPLGEKRVGHLVALAQQPVVRLGLGDLGVGVHRPLPLADALEHPATLGGVVQLLVVPLGASGLGDVMVPVPVGVLLPALGGGLVEPADLRVEGIEQGAGH